MDAEAAEGEAAEAEEVHTHEHDELGETAMKAVGENTMTGHRGS